MHYKLIEGYIHEKTDIDITSLNYHIDNISNNYKNEKVYKNNGFLKIINNDETIMRIAGNKIIDILSQKLNFSHDKLNMFLSPRLYYTNDKKNTSHRNQLPHFDHIRKIKVFLYLEDIDEDTGPTEFAPRSNNSLFLKYIRIIRFFSRIGTKGMKNIFLWNSYSSKLNFSKAIGKKGDIYIFDTDTVHKAGLVKELSKERKLLRFDFEINTHNQNLLLFCYKKISGLKKIISKT